MTSSSKALTFISLVSAIVLLLIFSEVTAAPEHGLKEDKHDDGHGYGGHHGHGGYGGHPAGGYHGVYYPDHGDDHDHDHGGHDHGCRYGCCGYGGRRCIRCCSYAGEMADAEPQVKPYF